ncbi:MAG: RluA family pseudouridine synthase [Opitutaceae bacterium]|jgi:23S rRNA pseudouridine1911/1915/1917 synthase|nr:RluA family pseudouridine synthase [Opitutaceae bacterium]
MNKSPSKTYIHPTDARRARADKLLAAAFPEHSRAAIQRAFAAGLVTLNNRPAAQNDTVRPGDTLALALPETRPAAIVPNPIPLEILFEDDALVAVNKPPGMTVHPGANTGGDTLVHALLAHCRGSLSGIGGVERPGIVHRLDRDTTGVIVAAKNDAAHIALSRQFADRSTRKTYLALVSGVPATDSGVINAPVGRHPVHRHKMAVTPKGRPARTDWFLVEEFPAAALLRCEIHTGRTHQIRVHLKHIGHPLLGDPTYGNPKLPDKPPPPRFFLHAARLVIAHPITQEPLVLEAPLPADFSDYLKQLRESGG